MALAPAHVLAPGTPGGCAARQAVARPERLPESVYRRRRAVAALVAAALITLVLDPRAVVHELAGTAGGAALEPGQRIVLDAAGGIAVTGISGLDEDGIGDVAGGAPGVAGGPDREAVTDEAAAAQPAGG